MCSPFSLVSKGAFLVAPGCISRTGSNEVSMILLFTSLIVMLDDLLLVLHDIRNAVRHYRAFDPQKLISPAYSSLSSLTSSPMKTK